MRFIPLYVGSVVLGCSLVHGSVACHAASSVQTLDGCDEFQEYLRLRQILRDATAEQQNAFATEWLPRLIRIPRTAGCGTGLGSPCWHAMSLANQLEDWGVARSLAEQGLAAAVQGKERAMWSMNVAAAAFHGRRTTDRASVEDASRAADAFLAVSHFLTSDVPNSAPAWLVPSLSTLTWKATCQRELQDFVGAGFTEQRGVTMFLASRTDVNAGYGGFLPEEALSRASLDYLKAGRPVEAAGCLVAIGALPQVVRSAGLHTYIAIADGVLLDPTGIKSLELMEELLRQQAVGDWTVLQVARTVEQLDPNQGVGPHHRAIACIERVLAEGEALSSRADATLQAWQSEVEVQPERDQDAGQFALLIQKRFRIELELGDFDGAQRSIGLLVARNAFTEEWRNRMAVEVEARRAARNSR